MGVAILWMVSPPSRVGKRGTEETCPGKKPWWMIRSKHQCKSFLKPSSGSTHWHWSFELICPHPKKVGAEIGIQDLAGRRWSRPNFLLFHWLHWVLVAASRIFSFSKWDLVPWPGIEPRPPALGAGSLRTTGPPKKSQTKRFRSLLSTELKQSWPLAAKLLTWGPHWVWSQGSRVKNPSLHCPEFLAYDHHTIIFQPHFSITSGVSETKPPSQTSSWEYRKVLRWQSLVRLLQFRIERPVQVVSGDQWHRIWNDHNLV